ncbi:MAG: AI-2E family transporter YdiK [Gammaproteobacteria bacterium]|nr:AI-2E family transporter YdiK [Gammaproteobacteria bacterium]MDH5176574.1 AI-2E family transporter YdiK [Gammaproteobacteria bacterium]MDH5227115.1 AI-2E family transporter YdiK [Gammaproteobacteria bacterium]
MQQTAEQVPPRTELVKTTLGVLFIGGLIVGSLWILTPFLPAFVWATMVVVATWPLMRRVESALGGRRARAVAVMSVGLLALLLVPLGIALHVILDHVDDLIALFERLPSLRLAAAPDWVGSLPLVGQHLAAKWNQLASEGMADLAADVQPYARAATEWFARQAGSFALLLLQFVLIVILSAVLYAGGESWGGWLRRFGRKLADEQGDRMVVLAGNAIRGVALGVVITALVQAGLGGIGLAIAGVPVAGVLTAVMFALCVAQLGPILVLLPATVWGYHSLGAGWGTFLLVVTIVAVVLDNVLRPVLIRRGADLPLLLIFAGVIGGLVTFGIVGIFVGPVVLAVAYTLLDDWVSSAPQAAIDPPGAGRDPNPSGMQ